MVALALILTWFIWLIFERHLDPASYMIDTGRRETCTQELSITGSGVYVWRKKDSACIVGRMAILEDTGIWVIYGETEDFFFHGLYSGTGLKG